MAALPLMENNDTIAKAMHSHVNEWPDRPEQVGYLTLDALSKECPTMMIQPLSGTIVDRKYVNGGYLGTWPFAIYLRIQPQDTAARIDASQVLKSIATYLTDGPLPSLIDNSMEPIHIIQVSSPISFGEQEDGTCDYQTIFNLKYKQRGR